MNKPTSLPALTALLVLAGATMVHGAVTIQTTGALGGYGGSNLDMNVFFDGAGVSSTGSPFFTAPGSTVLAGAFGGSVGISFDAMADVSLAPATLGDELTDANFNVDGAGFVGVAGGPNSGGIGGNATQHEGIRITFDEITGISPSIGIRLTGISVQNVGRPGTDTAGESFTIVNLMTRQSVTFDPLAESLSAGTFDVSGLDIFRVGGDAGDVASIISGDIGGFRIDGLTFETFAVPEPSVALLGGVGLLGLLRRRRA
ncbi:PEP-CTERM sorting domain-containing protein [Haloferula sargassicola]|uniref:PEP-CTERM protein-sorting domain-containing protein n=1 Tax=Haloferula sargassicola TaxID=490096 RepID=A0ABP9UHK6_9BACT